jgi:BirA family biotin operon repressor/biotin-[acetyl-CoA-carboxylase] ligase
MWLNLSEVHPLLRTDFVGRRVIYLTSTHSTQDIARREAEDGVPEGTVVIAEEQTAGRGRFGRRWVSPAGLNLYLTIVLRPDIAQLRALSMAAPLGVCRAVETVTDVQPLVKWPNDVITGGKKLAGVLIESEMSGENVRYALVGIGINVNYRVDDPEISGIATSLIQQENSPVSREKLLAVLMNEMESLYNTPISGGEVHDRWKARLDTLGREVTVRFQGESYEGVAEDVDAYGNLLLRLADGRVLTLEAGEVSLRGYG